jgi:NRPS condensation-like uncharacterized protein
MGRDADMTDSIVKETTNAAMVYVLPTIFAMSFGLCCGILGIIMVISIMWIESFETRQVVGVIGVLLILCGFMWFCSRHFHLVGL